MKSYLISQLWPEWPDSLRRDLVRASGPTGGLILVPFVTPAVPLIELYRAGHKVIAANSDQLALFSTRAALTNLEYRHLQSALSQLGDSLKSGQPLQERLSWLYQTICPRCQQPLSAAHFVWDRRLADPQAKGVDCQNCGHTGKVPVTEADLHHLDHIETRGIHYHFLLGRTVSPNLAVDNLLRNRIERWHDLYTPRNLYAIAELIMKIEATFTDKKIQVVMKAILLRCLWRVSNMVRRQEPRQLPQRLQVPIQSVEFNVWHCFEKEARSWSLQMEAIRTTTNPTDLLAGHQRGVLFFADRVEGLKRYLESESVSHVISSPPLIDRTRLALAALWSGWLLGLKAAETHYPMLSSRTTAWRTYQQDLIQVLYTLRPVLKPDAVWHFVFEAEYRLQPLAIILAAFQAGYDVEFWEFEAGQHHIGLITNPPERAAVLDVDQLTGLVVTEMRDVVLANAKSQRATSSVDRLCWLSWQSVLYSGLMSQVIASISEQQRLSWLQQQTDLVLDECKN